MESAFRNKVIQQLKKQTSQLDLPALQTAHGSPLFLLNPQQIVNQYRALQTALPMVEHHFAIKALRHPAAVAAVHQCDGFFDVMTNSDLDMVQAEGVAIPEKCIHTNPIKKPEDITYALAGGITTFVVDNQAEVDKFIPHRQKVRLLVRLSFPNPKAKSDLSFKFGVDPEEADKLVAYALQKGLDVAGLSLHVGSQINSKDAYVVALTKTQKLLGQMEAAHNHAFEILDIGGGFPVDYLHPMPSLQAIAEAITPILLPLAKRYRLLSEPGRFIVASSAVLLTQVVGKSMRKGQQWYYLNDGLYGSYSSVIYEDVLQPIVALKEVLQNESFPLASSVLAGPTCDSVDVITTHCDLPELEIGDFLISPMMGAYTVVSSTDYNGIPRTPIVVVGATY